MTAAPHSHDLGPITFSPQGEGWIEFGPPEARERVGFHDYARLYAVPGLYHHVFAELLDMRSAPEVTAALGAAWADAGVDPAGLRVLDLGAGTGAGGEHLRALGVGQVVALDLEPEAPAAAERERPGTYDDYVVGDVTALGDEERARLVGDGLDALVAVASLGFGHVPAAVLDHAVGLVRPGGWVAFGVHEALLPGTDLEGAHETGFPAYLAELLGPDGTGGERAQRVGGHAYRHRVHVDGTPHPAHAVVLRLRDGAEA